MRDISTRIELLLKTHLNEYKIFLCSNYKLLKKKTKQACNLRHNGNVT